MRCVHDSCGFIRKSWDFVICLAFAIVRILPDFTLVNAPVNGATFSFLLSCFCSFVLIRMHLHACLYNSSFVSMCCNRDEVRKKKYEKNYAPRMKNKRKNLWFFIVEVKKWIGPDRKSKSVRNVPSQDSILNEKHVENLSVRLAVLPSRMNFISLRSIRPNQTKKKDFIHSTVVARVEIVFWLISFLLHEPMQGRHFRLLMNAQFALHIRYMNMICTENASFSEKCTRKY